jgi:hypothetical protein
MTLRNTMTLRSMSTTQLLFDMSRILTAPGASEMPSYRSFVMAYNHLFEFGPDEYWRTVVKTGLVSARLIHRLDGDARGKQLVVHVHNFLQARKEMVGDVTLDDADISDLDAGPVLVPDVAARCN